MQFAQRPTRHSSVLFYGSTFIAKISDKLMRMKVAVHFSELDHFYFWINIENIIRIYIEFQISSLISKLSDFTYKMLFYLQMLIDLHLFSAFNNCKTFLDRYTQNLYIMSSAMVGDSFDYLFKMVVIGDSGVGKSNLLSRFSANQFSHQSKPTIGVQFATRTVDLENVKIKAQVWDTAGQERFRAITHAYYKGATGALLVFDITRRSSYDNLPKWLKQLKQNAQQNIVCILVGNKSDLNQQRSIRQQQVAQFAQQNKLFYLETSALESTNVEKAFMTVIKQIYEQMKKKQKTTPDATTTTSTNTNNRGKPTNTVILQNENTKNNDDKKKKKKCCE